MLPKICYWGKENYGENQHRATTHAGLDRALIPKYDKSTENSSASEDVRKKAEASQKCIRARSTIRNIDPKNATRSISDHKPVSTLFFFFPPSNHNNNNGTDTTHKRRHSLP
ncbi:MAG: hypothetical protein WA659_01570 [Candidatus Aquirickettsiella sp.]